MLLRYINHSHAKGAIQMKKTVKSFSLSPKVLEALKKKAKEEQRSESHVVDMMLAKSLA